MIAHTKWTYTRMVEFGVEGGALYFMEGRDGDRTDTSIIKDYINGVVQLEMVPGAKVLWR